MDSVSAFCPLPSAFPSREAFVKAIPAMIIEHNIHGVDIDPRAVQIAGLSLWLRAQKTWQQAKVHAQDRPQIMRSNVVCAEPMPGNIEQLKNFCESLNQPAIAGLVEHIFEKMKLAGEAGTLLKIEEEITELVATAKKDWLKAPKLQQAELFQADENIVPSKQDQSELGLDFSGITDEAFWDKAEERIYAALGEYAESAEGGDYQRRLFAKDAAQGFAFIDLCRKRYDAVVMNPPFGDASKFSQEYISEKYGKYGGDVFAHFVANTTHRLTFKGRVGVISNRTGFFIVSLDRWREEILLTNSRLALLADFGSGVLDAMVETAAYVIETNSNSSRCEFLRATSDLKKDSKLLEWISRSKRGDKVENGFSQNLENFNHVPSKRIAYWMPSSILAAFKRYTPYGDGRGDVQVGLQTSDNFRFIRLAWEVNHKTIATSKANTESALGKWSFYAKGGEYAPFHGDIHLLVKWHQNGLEVKNFTDDRGNVISYPRNERGYFFPGLTYTERTTSSLSVRVMPTGCCFDTKGPRITSLDSKSQLSDLAIMMSRVIAYMIEFLVGSADAAARDYTPRIIAGLPFPELDSADENKLAQLGLNCWKNAASCERINETNRLFCLPPLIKFNKSLSLLNLIQSSFDEIEYKTLNTLENTDQIEEHVAMLYGLDENAIVDICNDFGRHPCSYNRSDFSPNIEIAALFLDTTDNVIGQITQEFDLHRSASKNSYYSDKRLETISHAFQSHPMDICAKRKKLKLVPKSFTFDITHQIVAHQLGTALGRWDIRYATGERQPPELPDPFDPLPVCPPGMLQGEDGLPLAKDELRRMNDEGSYPLRVTVDGILVDDANDPEDIVRRVREALRVIWGERATAIQQEAIEILQGTGRTPKDLRDYFRTPGQFFASHLARYSKSRRKAPIYWPISTASGDYTLWLYYHRLDDQTLLRCVNRIQTKLERVAQERTRLDNEPNRTSKQDTELKELATFEDELRALQRSLEEISKFWKPNLNDGVQITAAPLWEHFRHKPWQKVLKDTWKKLKHGDYDWAHLAHSIWPERVVPKCAQDRSLAIAHGHEERLWHQVEVENGKGKKKQKTLEWQPVPNAEEVVAEILGEINATRA